jgi:hypothetical protein
MSTFNRPAHSSDETGPFPTGTSSGARHDHVGVEQVHCSTSLLPPSPKPPAPAPGSELPPSPPKPPAPAPGWELPPEPEASLAMLGVGPRSPQASPPAADSASAPRRRSVNAGNLTIQPHSEHEACHSESFENPGETRAHGPARMAHRVPGDVRGAAERADHGSSVLHADEPRRIPCNAKRPPSRSMSRSRRTSR